MPTKRNLDKIADKFRRENYIPCECFNIQEDFYSMHYVAVITDFLTGIRIYRAIDPRNIEDGLGKVAEDLRKYREKAKSWSAETILKVLEGE